MTVFAHLSILHNHVGIPSITGDLEFLKYLVAAATSFTNTGKSNTEQEGKIFELPSTSILSVALEDPYTAKQKNRKHSPA